MKRLLYFCSIAFIAVMLGGCDLLGGNSARPPSLPDLPGYKVVNNQQIADYLRQIGADSNQSELVGAVTAVDSLLSCYQDLGALQTRIYSNEAQPFSAGAILIADRNALLNPINLANCGSQAQSQGLLGVQPCSVNYTVSRDSNEYYIVYVGTTDQICQDFCSHLEGCADRPKR
jgi:hypothetical protein